ncbi:hypothetical protein RRG08_032631 [Elysia crispata]|uniref:Uncharacterized protein n=1 Tax=Elysia crispata TaxID=231223 RepID=A0AAE0Y0R4_9GAST|nr:hypothetical protein RRG08_032631 [Elysia crispata]
MAQGPRSLPWSGSSRREGLGSQPLEMATLLSRYRNIQGTLRTIRTFFLVSKPTLARFRCLIPFLEQGSEPERSENSPCLSVTPAASNGFSRPSGSPSAQDVLARWWNQTKTNCTMGENCVYRWCFESSG